MNLFIQRSTVVRGKEKAQAVYYFEPAQHFWPAASRDSLQVIHGQLAQPGRSNTHLPQGAVAAQIENANGNMRLLLTGWSSDMHHLYRQDTNEEIAVTGTLEEAVAKVEPGLEYLILGRVYGSSIFKIAE